MISDIRSSCGEFLKESGGKPLFKPLPKEYGASKRVKVRKRRTKDKFYDTFNKIMGEEDLRERSLFAYTSLDSAYRAIQSNEEIYYVFPIDGYKFVYNTAVENSEDNLRRIFDILNESARGEILPSLLKSTYSRHNLDKAFFNGTEILFYDIKCFFAVRCEIVKSYSDLFLK